MSRPLSPASRALREELVAIGGRYHRAGWMLGTAGNLSARTEAGAVVTASGRDKGALTPDDFVEVDLAGRLLGSGVGRRPSAETCIHLAVYRRRPEACAVLHVHTVASTLASPQGGVPGTLEFRDLEMIKGWGLWDPGDVARLPVFANAADVTEIAAQYERHLVDVGLAGATETPAMLIAGHGLTAFGDTTEAAHRHVEITEFLCRVWLQRACLPAARS